MVGELFIFSFYCSLLPNRLRDIASDASLTVSSEKGEGRPAPESAALREEPELRKARYAPTPLPEFSDSRESSSAEIIPETSRSAPHPPLRYRSYILSMSSMPKSSERLDPPIPHSSMASRLS